MWIFSVLVHTFLLQVCLPQARICLHLVSHMKSFEQGTSFSRSLQRHFFLIVIKHYNKVILISISIIINQLRKTKEILPHYNRLCGIVEYINVGHSLIISDKYHRTLLYPLNKVIVVSKLFIMKKKDIWIFSPINEAVNYV